MSSCVIFTFSRNYMIHCIQWYLDSKLGCHSSESPFLPVTFAVVTELTEDVILPEATVKELSEYGKMREVNVVDVDVPVNENVNDKCVNQCSNDGDDTHHNETNEQTEDELNEPTVSQCKDCNLRMGLRRSDHVPITPIVRPTLPFVVAHVDIIGPLDPI